MILPSLVQSSPDRYISYGLFYIITPRIASLLRILSPFLLPHSLILIFVLVRSSFIISFLDFHFPFSILILVQLLLYIFLSNSFSSLRVRRLFFYLATMPFSPSPSYSPIPPFHSCPRPRPLFLHILFFFLLLFFNFPLPLLFSSSTVSYASYLPIANSLSLLFFLCFFHLLVNLFPFSFPNSSLSLCFYVLPSLHSNASFFPPILLHSGRETSTGRWEGGGGGTQVFRLGGARTCPSSCQKSTRLWSQSRRIP